MNSKLMSVIFVLLVIFSIMTDDHSIAVASSDSTRAYVSNYGSGTVSVIDTNTNNVIATISGEMWPYGVAANPADLRHQNAGK